MSIRDPSFVPQNASAEQNTDSANSSGQIRALIVDDNFVNQKVAARILEKLGCMTEVVENGQEAFDIIDQQTFDIVFMDCQMPVMDGFEATNAIRNQSTLQPQIPIIALTANAMEGDRERCLDAGMDDYISKPVKTENFVQVLEKWVPPKENTSAGSISSDSSQKELLDAQVPILDQMVIEGLWELSDDSDFITELFDVFKQDVEERLALLRQPHTQSDLDAMRKIAHAFKGACANIGASRMVELCGMIEDFSQDTSETSIPDLIEYIAKEYQKVLQALDICGGGQ